MIVDVARHRRSHCRTYTFIHNTTNTGCLAGSARMQFTQMDNTGWFFLSRFVLYIYSYTLYHNLYYSVLPAAQHTHTHFFRAVSLRCRCEYFYRRRAHAAQKEAAGLVRGCCVDKSLSRAICFCACSRPTYYKYKWLTCMGQYAPRLSPPRSTSQQRMSHCHTPHTFYENVELLLYYSIYIVYTSVYKIERLCFLVFSCLCW